MMDYQDLIGQFIIAIAIIISGVLIANVLRAGLSDINSGLAYMGELIRSGLSQGTTP